MKFIIVALLVLVLISLFSALRQMVKSTEKNSTVVVKRLAIRVGLSFLLVALLLIGAQLGWITPNSVTF